METTVTLPEGFEETMAIPNAAERLREAREVGNQLLRAGVPLLDHPDHYAIFSEPPRLLAEPLRGVGYVVGSDNRCYPSPVDGCDYINVAASLPRNQSGPGEGLARPHRCGSSPGRDWLPSHDGPGVWESFHPSHHLGHQASG